MHNTGHSQPPPVVKVFSFNPLGVNCFVISDSTGACIIVDPGCYTQAEKIQLREYIESNKLQPKYIINTHCHFDHIFGVRFVTQTFGVPWLVHKEDLYLLKGAKNHTEVFGFDLDEPPLPDGFLAHGDSLVFGNSRLEIIHVPGHSRGSICLFSAEGKFLIAGDVLFHRSIGRSDLPGGDYDQLIQHIRSRLLVLPPDILVYPGHGPTTTIGEESQLNPFLAE